MKYFIYFLIFCAVSIIGYNLSIINFSDPFAGDSSVALIGIVASLCVIVLMLILLISKKIEKQQEQ